MPNCDKSDERFLLKFPDEYKQQPTKNYTAIYKYNWHRS